MKTLKRGFKFPWIKIQKNQCIRISDLRLTILYYTLVWYLFLGGASQFKYIQIQEDCA